MQATALINLECNKCGVDKIGWSYLTRAVGMGHDLGLFAKLTVRSRRERVARAVTAWGLFSQQA